MGTGAHDSTLYFLNNCTALGLTNMRRKSLKSILIGSLLIFPALLSFYAGRAYETLKNDDANLTRLYLDMIVWDNLTRLYLDRHAWESGNPVEKHISSIKHRVIAEREATREREWWLRLIPVYGQSVISSRDGVASEAKAMIRQEEEIIRQKTDKAYWDEKTQ